MDGAVHVMIITVLKPISLHPPPQMELTEHQQYENAVGRRKTKTHFTSVEACSVPHRPAQRYMLKKNQAKRSLQNDKNCVYVL